MRISIIIAILSQLSDPLSAQVRTRCYKIILKAFLSKDIPKITVPEAAKASDHYLFPDAREAEEYNVSHVPDERFVGYKNLTLESLRTVSKN